MQLHHDSTIHVEEMHIRSEIMGKLNYIATDKAFRNTQKSEWHEYIILKFQAEKD